VTYNVVLMGTFSVKFVLKNPLHSDLRLELEGLVDTGALFTQIPTNLVTQIGLVASGTRAVHYADGTKDVVPVADAKIAINGVETSTMVLCGKPNSLVLLGATTLETLGLGVDPIHKRLIPVEAPMAPS
jgi:clan AA aspartic protease